ncbi:hypothetical protein, partial [Clostridium sp. HBUAS56017]|uniref:hypothetical protein n=1 Tax=Clostridium sp. HBUAS56017 TaxID=2571128 RepID=UPI00163DD519
THTVIIEVTGQKNASASDSYINLDAFDIIDGNITTPPTATNTRVEENNANLKYSTGWGSSSGSSNSGNTNI